MGVSKRALMEEYYIDEWAEVMAQWAALHGIDAQAEGDVEDFLSGMEAAGQKGRERLYPRGAKGV